MKLSPKIERLKLKSIINLRAITGFLMFFAVLLTLIASLIILLGQRRLLESVRQISNENSENIKTIQENSEKEHDRLLKQIGCLSEISIVAARGNDVVIKSFEDCKYTSTPQITEQPRIIFQDRIIREVITPPSSSSNPTQSNEPTPGAQGKGRNR